MPVPETPAGAGPPALAVRAALVAEAARKSRVCWLSYDHAGGTVSERLVWHAWYDDGLVVLSDGDQPLEGVADASTVEVVMRAKDSRARLVTWQGRAEVVTPGTEAWDGHAAALLGVRLNLPDPAAALERWRTEATILRVTPAEETGVEGGGPLP